MAHHHSENSRRSGVWTIIGLCLVVIAGIVVVTRFISENSPLAEQCTATTTDGQYTLAQGQMADAATITAVGMAMHLPERAIVVALATSLQESKLVNLPGGDRDSVGLFQQRPSQGWGTALQISDPTYSAGKFYSALVQVPNYTTISVGEAAQAVQNSADPSGASYEVHQPEATVLAAALSGVVPASGTCQFPADPMTTQTPGSDGFTPRADAVWTALSNQFGSVVTRTSVTGAQSSGGQPAPALGGLGVDLSYPVSDGNEIERGWAVATWAVAQAATMGITTVSYDGQTWSAANSSAGWQKSAAGGAGTSTLSVGVAS